MDQVAVERDNRTRALAGNTRVSQKDKYISEVLSQLILIPAFEFSDTESSKAPSHGLHGSCC